MNIHWVVQYNDGTQHDSDESGEGFKYQDIDRDNLSQFRMMDGNRVVAVLHLTPERKLIYRKRVAVNVMTNNKVAVFLFGWQETIEFDTGPYVAKKSAQTLCALFEDGHIEVVNGFKENHPWFGKINFRPEEEL